MSPDQPETEPRPRLRFRLRHHRMYGKDFALVYREGSRAKSSLMTVAVRANGLGRSRMGLSIGKKCWKSAVKRNRVRRVFREAFRLSLPVLPPGLDVVLISSTPRIEPRLAETQGELIAMVRKAHRRYLEKSGAKDETRT